MTIRQRMRLFIRAYHAINHKCWIIKDELAYKLLDKEDYKFMSYMISDNEEERKYQIETQHSSEILAQYVFIKDMLNREKCFGLKQVVLMNPGYDCFCLGIKTFELDDYYTLKNKCERLASCFVDYASIMVPIEDNESIDKVKEYGYDSNLKSAFVLMNSSDLYLRELKTKLLEIADLIPSFSSILFDYNSDMYSEKEIIELLADCGYRLYIHNDQKIMNDLYFNEYNMKTADYMILAPKGRCYCVGVKK